MGRNAVAILQITKPRDAVSCLRVYMGVNMATYSYSRVSTQRQADEGESLGTQRRRVEGYAMMVGLTVDEHFIEEGVSGSVPFAERPEGKRLLATVKPGDVVITP